MQWPQRYAGAISFRGQFLGGGLRLALLPGVAVPTQVDQPQVFVSYASHDVATVKPVVDQFQQLGLSVWRDHDRILGGDNFGPEIVRGIRESQVLILMMSAASMRSKNVKQEIQLAWTYNVPYLPLRIEPVGFAEQVEYWLSGCQWIDLYDRTATGWLPEVQAAIQRRLSEQNRELPIGNPVGLNSLDRLWHVAGFTDQIWPVKSPTLAPAPLTRGLGAPQDGRIRRARLGDEVRLVLEFEEPGYLTLLDRGPEGILYGLCPSAFAPNPKIAPGRMLIPQLSSPVKGLVVTGNPGREELLAIVTREPLQLGWGTTDPVERPAHVLSRDDVNRLLEQLDHLEPDAWTVRATSFVIDP